MGTSGRGRRFLTALGFLWTLPNTLLGALLGLLTFQRPRLAHGLLLFDRSARGYSKLVPLFGYTAQTFGFVIIGTERVEGRLLAHERAHVRQYMAWGPLFLPAYGVLFLRFGYRRHPFEVAAERRAAARP
jgi:hypothetical protein